jgi:hypothetical protein
MLLAFRQSFSTSFLYRTVRIGGGSTRKFSEIPPCTRLKSSYHVQPRIK